MERRLKERLVGAAILVVLIVLVVPALLSGPKTKDVHKQTSSVADSTPEPTRTVTVDLNTQRTVALEPTPDDAAASAQPPSEPAAVAPPVAAVTPALVASAPAAPSAPSAAMVNPAASPRSWTLQLGSFASRANAYHLVQVVKVHNSPAYLSTIGTGNSVRYRVRVGPLTDRAAAERMLAKLKSEGHVASVVTP